MRAKLWQVAALCGAMLVLPAAAEEPKDEPKPETPETAPKEAPAEEKKEAAKPKATFEEPPLHRWGGLRLTAFVWQPTANGADDVVATRFNGTERGLNAALAVAPKSALSDGYRATWLLPRHLGAFDFGYDAIRNSTELERLEPGVFVFGESLVIPGFAGIADDGFSDGFQAKSITKSRRFRAEYAHTAFESPRATGTWHAGLHFLGHSKDVHSTYYALAPNLPPVLPPSNANPALFKPIPDYGQWQSDFSGTGIGAGLDVQYHVHPRVDIVSGFALGVVGGNQKLQYRSRTQFYTWTDPNPPNETIIPTFDELVAFLQDVGSIPNLQQFVAQGSMIEDHTHKTVEDFEAYFGVEGKAWRTLRVFLLLRGLAFVDAATEITPSAGNLISTPTGFGYQITDFSRTDHSIAYVGFVVGLSYRF